MGAFDLYGVLLCWTVRCHFDSWCNSGSIAGSLGSMYSYPSCTIRPASAVICTTEPLMPIQCPLDIRSTSIQAITRNVNSQPYSTLCELSLNLHYNKPPGKHTIQLSDILHYLWAGGHLRHSVCSICHMLYLPSAGYGEPGIYSLSKCTFPSLVLFAPRHKVPLPFSFLCKRSASPCLTTFRGLDQKVSFSNCNILLSFLDSSFQCLKSFPFPSDKNIF